MVSNYQIPRHADSIYLGIFRKKPGHLLRAQLLKSSLPRQCALTHSQFQSQPRFWGGNLQKELHIVKVKRCPRREREIHIAMCQLIGEPSIDSGYHLTMAVLMWATLEFGEFSLFLGIMSQFSGHGAIFTSIQFYLIKKCPYLMFFYF